MGWLRLTIESGADLARDLSEFFEAFGATSVSLSPAGGGSVIDDGVVDMELWGRTRVTALFDPEVDIDILMACLRNRAGAGRIFHQQVDMLGDRDWVLAQRGGQGPVHIGDRLCICPSWITPPPVDHVLVLDPGLAFGSGRHATTRLCLEWLGSLQLHGRTVIDYGCGSGILGIAAALLGASRVLAIDTDPQAMESSRANAERNGVLDRIEVLAARNQALPDADIIIANILLNPLLALAESFGGALQPGGMIALSGLFAHQARECSEAYAPWFNMMDPRYSGEWALLTGERR